MSLHASLQRAFRKTRFSKSVNVMLRELSEQHNTFRQNLIERVNEHFHDRSVSRVRNVQHLNFNVMNTIDQSRLNLFRTKHLTLPRVLDTGYLMNGGDFPTDNDPFETVEPNNNEHRVFNFEDDEPIPVRKQLIDEVEEAALGDKSTRKKGELAAVEMLHEIEKDTVYKHYFEANFAIQNIHNEQNLKLMSK